jgi:hypothetical protein
MSSKPFWLGTDDPHARLRMIETLDLETQYREITQLFYADFQSVMLTKGFNGFMFNNAASRISRILGSTGELERRIAKRVVDTTILATAVMQHGFKEGAGRDAARRVNAMHSRYDIHPDDFLAVAAEETLGTLELAERYGWRPVTSKEQEALRLFYNHQARAFGSTKDLASSIPELKTFFSHYLDTQLNFEPQNEKLARVLIRWYGEQVPGPFRGIFRTLLVADLDPRIIRACGLRQPFKLMKLLAQALMRRTGRKDPVPDGVPNGLEDLIRSVYPNGWTFDDLGGVVKAKTAA